MRQELGDSKKFEQEFPDAEIIEYVEIDEDTLKHPENKIGMKKSIATSFESKYANLSKEAIDTNPLLPK